MKKSLTAHYVLHQMAYWAASAGVVSFAAAFLLDRGFAASHVGMLLACGNLLSCACQPLLADLADRVGGNAVKWMTAVLTAVCMGCFACVGAISMPGWLFGGLYLLGVFSLDAMMPLNNAICVHYTASGYSINYGIGRGLGALAFSLAALGIGKVMAAAGAQWMIWIALGMLGINLAVTLVYPSVIEEKQAQKKEDGCCSVAAFFRCYRWYCVSLVGVMCLAMFHAMTENYLIEVVTPLGGDSGSVGIALFIATAAEMAVLLFFDKIRGKIADNMLLKQSGIGFLTKAVLLWLAPSVVSIYFIQLMQTVTYCFLSPTQLYYANAKIRKADMVKGQAFITAAYTLGCAAGNFIGGQLLTHFGVRMLLTAGIGMAACGAAVLILTVDKKD